MDVQKLANDSKTFFDMKCVHRIRLVVGTCRIFISRWQNSINTPADQTAATGED